MSRIAKVQKLLKEHHLQALIIDNPIDLFYLTGKELSLGRIVIESHLATLFVDGRYYEGCRHLQGVNVVLTAAYGEGSEFIKWWHLKGKRVGFDAESTSYATYQNFSHLGSELVALSSPLLRIREIKEPQEIKALQHAAEIGSQGFDYICSNLLKAGITEKELTRKLELFWLQSGGDKLSFSPIIAFGNASAQPHYRPTDIPLKEGDIVLIDIGVVVGHYHSDMTRVVSLGPPRHPKLEEIYKIVLEAQLLALALCKPGVEIGHVDSAARSFIEANGYKDYFPHGLGHGVGLEIHESPRIRSTSQDAKRVLEEGMVITIEPGIYLPGVGGVRLEDTIVITEDGYLNLTNRLIAPSLPHIQ